MNAPTAAPAGIAHRRPPVPWPLLRALAPWALTAVLLMSSGCSGTLELGVESKPTPDPRPVATITALKEENARLAAQLAARPTPAPPQLSLGRLAYVQGSDIWFRPLPDGRPQRLTSDGRNREPRWSPSGNWLAFRKERSVYVRREIPCDIFKPRQDVCNEWASEIQRQVWVADVAGGDEYQVSLGRGVTAFAWSPTRDRLAYVTTAGALWATGLDAATTVSLVPTVTAGIVPGRAGQFAWSPDGLWLAFEWSAEGAAASGPATVSGTTAIHVVTQDGRERRVLHAPATPGGQALLAGWSSDGEAVLFWEDRARPGPPDEGAPLYAVRATGGTPSVSSPTPVLPLSGFATAAPLSALPELRGTIALAAGSGQRTWLNKTVRAGPFSTADGVAAIWPAWSHDGARLAYSAMPEVADLDPGPAALQELLQRRIWIVDLTAGTVPRRITGTLGYRDERPQWSADGGHVLFSRLDTRGRASVWLVSLADGAARQVVEELTPAPDAMGLYGYVDWDTFMDWWPAPAR